ncbi:MAG TPA: polysaccharide biosynthesis/export family protein [Parvibaculum sp.]|uniref:polysaccharide biosynthesis/export family protein n=1 Tax=Parvibaculum sp. TaxID=2024848 RepID=UPI002BC5198F|nr:polysaccharide biosynthesis/export family protein [Parvibaculum sp.]HMM15647.1 polysaccharide biosynthesis/export family protein [Parvibaculum sp.]
MRSWFPTLARRTVASLAGVAVAVGLVVFAAAPVRAESGAGAGQAVAGDLATDYFLGTGDKLRVIVYGEQDLSGEFDVTGSGKVSLPLIGQVQAAGLTLAQFEKEVADHLANGYLTNPRVSAEVLNYRPFYIIGEVSKPGQYPYTNGMTVLNAVAVGGGYTYRANTDAVYITRGDGGEVQYPAMQSVKVLPGDIVRIPERFF